MLKWALLHNLILPYWIWEEKMVKLSGLMKKPKGELCLLKKEIQNKTFVSKLISKRWLSIAKLTLDL